MRPLPVEALLAAYHSSDQAVQRQALKALADHADPGSGDPRSGDEGVVDVLAEAFEHGETQLRAVAAGGLARFPGARTAGLLAAALANPQEPLRASIVMLLGSSRRQDAAEALRTLLPDPDPTVRFHAIYALKEAAPPRWDVSALLRPLLQDEHARVRLAAAGALGKIGLGTSDPGALAWLANAREKAPLADRARALGTLVGTGVPLDDARLSGSLDGLRRAVDMSIAEMVGSRVVDEDVWGRIHEPIWGTSEKLRKARDANRSLLRTIVARIEERGDTAQPIRLLADPGGAVREFAAEALGRLGCREAVGPLSEALAGPTTAENREVIAAALRALTGQDLGPDGIA